MARIRIQNDSHWHTLRGRYISASEVAALFNQHPWMSQYELYLNKREGKQVVEYDNERIRAGSFLEPAIAKWFAGETGIKLRKSHCYYTNDTYKLGCTPDFMTVKGNVLAEIKNCDVAIFNERWRKWNPSKQEYDEKPPIYYQLQLQTQMICTGMEEGYIICCVGGNQLKYWKYQQHKPAMNNIKKASKAFWERVEKGEAPHITNKDYTALMTYYQIADESQPPVDLSKDIRAQKLTRELDHVQRKRKRIEREEKKLKAKLMVMVGDSRSAFTEKYKISAPTVNIPASVVERKASSYRKLSLSRSKG